VATAYVLIDYENVQPTELGAFGRGGYKVMVFVGGGQKSVATALISALQALPDPGKITQIEGRGPNALDMHIAYYIGRLAVADPGAVFHIISKDRDYDPLILHLKGQNIACTRWKSVAEIQAARASVPPPAKPVVKPVKAAPKVAAPKAPPARPAKAAPKPIAKAVQNRVEGVIQNFAKRDGRPSTAAKLASTIKSIYRGLADKDVAVIVEELKLRGVIVVDGDKVTYHLP
jgi:hypothetical protein